MAVHINEVHTDIRPAGTDAGDSAPSPSNGHGRTTDDSWLESRGRTRWLEARTSSYGYED
jgi:hypothetical protein